MQLKIELFREDEEGASIVIGVAYAASLDEAKAEAAILCRQAQAVSGFQVRDMERGDRIIWSQEWYD